MGRPRLAQKFRWQKLPSQLTLHVDSDFAGCMRTRKSTNGGVVQFGDHTLKTWAKTQSVIALSSGEAELGAIVKGSTEAMGMRSVLADFGIPVTLRILSDASAAIGMVRREGLGKVRHLATGDLWVQEKQRTGEISYDKVWGKENPADILTKGVNQESSERAMQQLGFEASQRRSTLAPKLT